MITAAAERIEEFSLEIRFLPLSKSRLNIIHSVVGTTKAVQGELVIA
jgi:hypothetical protein